MFLVVYRGNKITPCTSLELADLQVLAKTLQVLTSSFLPVVSIRFLAESCFFFKFQSCQLQNGMYLFDLLYIYIYIFKFGLLLKGLYS